MDKHTPLTKITKNKESKTPTGRKTIFKGRIKILRYPRFP
jgi:hypothetical protein